MLAIASWESATADRSSLLTSLHATWPVTVCSLQYLPRCCVGRFGTCPDFVPCTKKGFRNVCVCTIGFRHVWIVSRSKTWFCFRVICFDSGQNIFAFTRVSDFECRLKHTNIGPCSVTNGHMWSNFGKKKGFSKRWIRINLRFIYFVVDAIQPGSLWCSDADNLIQKSFMNF